MVDRKIRIKGLLRYIMCILAFVCGAFVYHSFSVSAAPTISLPSNEDFNYEDGLTFYVGYDAITVNTVKYKFNDNDYVTISDPTQKGEKNSVTVNYYTSSTNPKASAKCKAIGYLSCTDIILEYKISKTALIVPAANTTSSGTKDGKFNFTVYAKNWGSSEKTVEGLVYDAVAPTVTGVSISRGDTSTKQYLSKGDKITFNVSFNEYMFVSSNPSLPTKLSFKIGNNSFEARCNTNTSASSTMLSCSHTVQGGYIGDINTIKLVNPQNIKDVYNNKMGTSPISINNVTNENNLKVDSIKPSISSIVAMDGVYSYGYDVGVTVTFSEIVSVPSTSDIPVLTAKFGSGENITCSYSSSTNQAITYSCGVGSKDQGEFKIISLVGDKVKDSAGNVSDLDISSLNLNFEDVVADNSMPTVSSVSLETVGCTATKYCSSGHVLSVTFNFNMEVEINSRDIRFKFDGKEAAGAYEWTFYSAEKKAVARYIIRDADDGVFSLDYSFDLVGKSNRVTNEISSNEDYEYSIDNASPTLIFDGVYYNDNKVSGNAIYGTKNDSIVYKFKVNDSSLVTLDVSKISIKDNACVGNNCDIVGLDVTLENDVLSITVKTADYEIAKAIVLIIEKEALTDYFENNLASNYETNSITFNSYSPVYTVDVEYPEYKGYENASGWYLTSGNVINFSINSTDMDLKGYCIVDEENDECLTYHALNSSKYSYAFEDSSDGEYKYYLKVVDTAGNVTVKDFNFTIKNVFEYKNDISLVSKNHEVTADLAILAVDTSFKYNWFKEGQAINFANAYNSVYKNEKMSFEGSEEYQGNYRLCIGAESQNAILCSEYLAFDNKVDSFTVNISSSWTKDGVTPVLDFNDSSAIKCIAIGKDVSNINCDSGSANGVTVYRTAQAVSPFNKYRITSNGIYYFYIEDVVGNSKLITKTVNTIDSTPITIDVYNGNSNGYIENLEQSTYKRTHKFKVVFDRDISVGSQHSSYHYFFSTSNCNIVNEDNFKAYYLNSSYKNQVAVTNREIMIATPFVSGVYNLYIMAKDASGNVSFKTVSDIRVDIDGPTINISSLTETNYITNFDFTVSVRDSDSKLDSNNIYYAFVTSLNQIDGLNVNNMFKYDGCGYASLTCSIVGNNLDYEDMVFLPTETYRLVVFAYDIAGNKGVASSDGFTKDTTVPKIEIVVNDSNKNIVTIKASKDNSGTLSGVYYCVNECEKNGNYDLEKFTALQVGTLTSVNRTINLNLEEGINTLYVYAVDIYGNANLESVEINYVNNIVIYTRGYLTSDSRVANIIVHNIKQSDVVSIKYILTDVDNREVFDEESIISDSINSCDIYDEITCYSTKYSEISQGAYKVSLTADKRVIFYVYVNGNLIYDYAGNLLELIIEDADPVFSFASSNPTIISTLKGEHLFEVTVSDHNITNSLIGKYILSSNNSINKNNFMTYYDTCLDSNSCARGEYNLVDSNGVIEISSSLSKFNSLLTGTYYLYVYAIDDAKNAGVGYTTVQIDNTSPEIAYSIGGSSYTNIINEVFVNSAPILRFRDTNLEYVEIFDMNDELITVCYKDSDDEDVNCAKNSISVGFVVSNEDAYYYLNSGTYTVIAYDSLGNSTSVRISDSSQSAYPVINLYKLVEGTYEKQSSVVKVYNDLNSLYVSVSDDDVSNITVSLYDSVTSTIGNSFRYTNSHSDWMCLVDAETCNYGKALSSLLGSSVGNYDAIIIEVSDNINNISRMTIKYDVIVPVITVLGVGDSILVDGKVYEFTTGNVVEFDIGVNLTLNQFLNKVVVDVDGYSYDNVRYKESFNVTVDGDYEGNLFTTAGAYDIKFDYVDEAGNKAVTKAIRIIIKDSLKPTLEIVGTTDILELNEEATVSFVKASDNYGFNVEGEIVKELNLYLEDSIKITLDGVEIDFNKIDKVSENLYKFSVAGLYEFTYEVTDYYNNKVSVTQEIIVMDSKAPDIKIEGETSQEINVLDRVNGNINIPSVSVEMPTAYDVGDDENKSVTYLGLYALSTNGEKYSVNGDYCEVSGSEVVCSLVKTGTYYLRFTATDDSLNTSVFDYEVKVLDKLAPVINGIENGKVISVSLSESFDVEEDIIDVYEVSVSDNYDENVLLDYVVNQGAYYTYDVVFSAYDLSSNAVSIVVHVEMVDEIAPVTGDIDVDLKTNSNNLAFNIFGGSDNTNNWWHEFKVGEGEWNKYTAESVLPFEDNLSGNVKVCIKAVDNYKNEGEVKCVDVYVDTTDPVISGINDGDIVDKEVTLNVTDDLLHTVNVYRNGVLLDINMSNLPITLSDVGTYTVEATDEVNNMTTINFMINLDKSVNIVNDINASERTETAVAYDTRLLVKANFDYNSEGYSKISVNLDNINVNTNDIVYVLGVVPNSESKFIMFSVTGENLDSYNSQIEVLAPGENFSDKYDNEECFLLINDEYYAYVIVQENQASSDLTTSVNDKEEESSVMKTLMIILGSLAVLMIGYQVIKFRRRVKAA